MMLIIKYSFFAVLSTAVNLLFQFFCFHLYQGVGELYVAMFTGTLAGLISKYYLDKKWIFYDSTHGGGANAKKFTLYSLMGVFTTAIFWGTEMFFHYFVAIPYAQYFGAVLGLGIGYVVKYSLDKKYVFLSVGAH